MPTRCCWPPESCRGRLRPCPRGRRGGSSSRAGARLRRTRRGSRADTQRCRGRCASRSRLKCWKIMPMSWRMGRRSALRRARRCRRRRCDRLAVGRLLQAVDQAQRVRFARAGVADHAEDGTPLDREGDAVDGGDGRCASLSAEDRTSDVGEAGCGAWRSRLVAIGGWPGRAGRRGPRRFAGARAGCRPALRLEGPPRPRRARPGGRPRDVRTRRCRRGNLQAVEHLLVRLEDLDEARRHAVVGLLCLRREDVTSRQCEPLVARVVGGGAASCADSPAGPRKSLFTIEAATSRSGFDGVRAASRGLDLHAVFGEHVLERRRTSCRRRRARMRPASSRTSRPRAWLTVSFGTTTVSPSGMSSTLLVLRPSRGPAGRWGAGATRTSPEGDVVVGEVLDVLELVDVELALARRGVAAACTR